MVKEDADENAAAAAEVIDDGILQQIDAEEAAEIEFERTTMYTLCQKMQSENLIPKLRMARKMCLLIYYSKMLASRRRSATPV